MSLTSSARGSRDSKRFRSCSYLRPPTTGRGEERTAHSLAHVRRPHAPRANVGDVAQQLIALAGVRCCRLLQRVGVCRHESLRLHAVRVVLPRQRPVAIRRHVRDGLLRARTSDHD
jgi:hypothetical protein